MPDPHHDDHEAIPLYLVDDAVIPNSDSEKALWAFQLLRPSVRIFGQGQDASVYSLEHLSGQGGQVPLGRRREFNPVGGCHLREAELPADLLVGDALVGLGQRLPGGFRV